jgi:hypothetical protein
MTLTRRFFFFPLPRSLKEKTLYMKARALLKANQKPFYSFLKLPPSYPMLGPCGPLSFQMVRQPRGFKN